MSRFKIKYLVDVLHDFLDILGVEIILSTNNFFFALLFCC